MAKKPPVEQKHKTRKKILVVDDYLPTRRLIIDALNQSSHYEISEAENGIDAIGLFDTTD